MVSVACVMLVCWRRIGREVQNHETIMVTMVTVWDPFMVMVTTHTQPVTTVTMVTTWASVTLKNNLDPILNLTHMVTIPGNILFHTYSSVLNN